MSSLAFDNSQAERHGRSAVMDFEPELLVVKPRSSRSHVSFPLASLEEVVQISGRFTVSF